jgi:hypothetical protein
MTEREDTVVVGFGLTTRLLSTESLRRGRPVRTSKEKVMNRWQTYPPLWGGQVFAVANASARGTHFVLPH